MSLLSSNPAIASLIDQLWNKFWSGGISNPLTAIEQISYLLFMRKLDDLDVDAIAHAEFSGEQYQSLFEGTYLLPQDRPNDDPNSQEWKKAEKDRGVALNTLRWGHIKQITSTEKMLDHVQRYAFPFLKDLNDWMKLMVKLEDLSEAEKAKKMDRLSSPFSRHMGNAVFIIPKPSLLKEAIDTINNLYTELEKDAKEKGHDFQDIQGDVYEMLLSEIASAGKNGQFRTPRHIIKLVVELVAPQDGQRIADPACGTGGFLLEAYQYIVTNQNTAAALEKIEPDDDGFVRTGKSPKLTQAKKTQLGQNLRGFDIDQTMVRLGLMNLMMHGIENPQIDYTDTLSKAYHEVGEYDVVLANPPFTGNIDKGDINQDLKLGTTKTELLFIERIFHMLKRGGTAGIIIPQGVLFGSAKAFKNARSFMIDHSELKAVISMPSGVFKPYAGVSTAILIFTKGGETENVWFYDMASDGYSLDDKRTELKNKDGQRDHGDVQTIVQAYTNRTQFPADPELAEGGEGGKSNRKNTKHFFVPKAEIVAEGYDLSFSTYEEPVFEEIEYESPVKILEKLIGKNGKGGLERDIVDGLRELRESL